MCAGTPEGQRPQLPRVGPVSARQQLSCKGPLDKSCAGAGLAGRTPLLRGSQPRHRALAGTLAMGEVSWRTGDRKGRQRATAGAWSRLSGSGVSVGIAEGPQSQAQAGHLSATGPSDPWEGTCIKWPPEKATASTGDGSPEKVRGSVARWS